MQISIYKMAIGMAFTVFIGSCSGVRKAKEDMLYLRQGKLDTIPNLSVPVKEAVIQKDDLLSIVVFSDNAEATAIFNQQGTGSGTVNTSITTAPNAVKSGSGYLVDKAGNIRFQGLGLVKAEGLTRMQLMDSIALKLQPFLKNPYVDIRFLNSRVTIIGEVQRPGVFNLQNEKISVLELLGLAGDITIYGKRDNVLVIREQNGQREFGRIDLRRSDIFQSPYFYLQQNDMVVVEPNSKKPTATEQDNFRKIALVTTLATLVSTASILITLF